MVIEINRNVEKRKLNKDDLEAELFLEGVSDEKENIDINIKKLFALLGTKILSIWLEQDETRTGAGLPGAAT